MGLVAAALAIAAGAALAQPLEVITVEGVRELPAGRSTRGYPINEITIRSRVSYADLDLTSQWGALQLENRIRDAAKSACGEIEVKFPVEGSTDAKCIKDAVDAAMVDARKAIDAKRSAVAKK